MSPAARLGAGAATGVAVVALTWDDSRLGDPGHRWAIVAAVIVATLVGGLLEPVGRVLPRAGSFPLLLVPVLAATYACVPETDQTRPLAAALGASIVVEVIARGSLPWWWHGALAALVLWGGIYGATGRQSALVGALFAWWPVLLVGALALVAPRSGEVAAWAVALVGSAAAVWMARTGGLEPTREPAVRAVVIGAAASLVLSLMLVVSALLLSARRARPAR